MMHVDAVVDGPLTDQRLQQFSADVFVTVCLCICLVILIPIRTPSRGCFLNVLTVLHVRIRTGEAQSRYALHT